MIEGVKEEKLLGWWGVMKLIVNKGKFWQVNLDSRAEMASAQLLSSPPGSRGNHYMDMEVTLATKPDLNSFHLYSLYFQSLGGEAFELLCRQPGHSNRFNDYAAKKYKVDIIFTHFASPLSIVLTNL